MCCLLEEEACASAVSGATLLEQWPDFPHASSCVLRLSWDGKTFVTLLTLSIFSVNPIFLTLRVFSFGAVSVGPLLRSTRLFKTYLAHVVAYSF